MSEVAWDSPAFSAGIVQGDVISGIDGDSFGDADDLADAITAAKRSGKPIQLLLMSGKHYRVVQVDDRTGLRYPHLVRDGASPASLDAILAPKG